VPRLCLSQYTRISRCARTTTAPVATLRALYAAHAEFPLHVLENGLPDVPLTVFANELYRILLNSPYVLPRLMLQRIVGRFVAMPPVLLSLV
jgi:hypothetical protein